MNLHKQGDALGQRDWERGIRKYMNMVNVEASSGIYY